MDFPNPSLVTPESDCFCGEKFDFSHSSISSRMTFIECASIPFLNKSILNCTLTRGIDFLFLKSSTNQLKSSVPIISLMSLICGGMSFT